MIFHGLNISNMTWIIILVIFYSFNVAITAFAISSPLDGKNDNIMNVFWAVLWPLFWCIMLFWVMGERIYWWIYYKNLKRKINGNRPASKAASKSQC